MINENLQGMIDGADLSYFDRMPFAIGEIGAGFQVSSNTVTRPEVQIDQKSTVQ